jgi:hypothetical protein
VASSRILSTVSSGWVLSVVGGNCYVPMIDRDKGCFEPEFVSGLEQSGIVDVMSGCIDQIELHVFRRLLYVVVVVSIGASAVPSNPWDIAFLDGPSVVSL